MWRWRIWRRSSSPCTKRSSSSRNNCTSRKQKRKSIPWWLKNLLLKYITPAYHHARNTTSPSTKKEIHMSPPPTHTATSSMITPIRLAGRTASPTSSCGESFKERARRIWVLWRRKECTSIRWASSTTKAMNLSGIGHLSTVILIYVDSY